MYSLSEVAGEIQGTSDNCELLEPIDLLQHSVVGNLVAGVDRSKRWEGDVGQVSVVNKDKTTSGSEVRCSKGWHGIAVETQVLSDVGKGWQRDRAAVTESHILSRFKQRERSVQSRHVAVVGLNIQCSLNVGNLQADVLQRGVVVDVEGCDLFQVG